MFDALVDELADEMHLPLAMARELATELESAMFDITDRWLAQYGESACLWPQWCACDMRQRRQYGLRCDYHGLCLCGGPGWARKCEMHPLVTGAEPWALDRFVDTTTDLSGFCRPVLVEEILISRRDAEARARAARV